MSQTKTEPNTSAKPTKLRGSRLVAAIVVTLLVFVGTMSMALVAISVQTGYFRAGLPSQIQRVELLLIGRTVEVATYAPLALEVGQYTKEPVKTDFGYHVIMLEDSRELKLPTFEEAKPQIAQRMAQQIVEKHVNDLRAKAKVVQ